MPSAHRLFPHQHNEARPHRGDHDNADRSAPPQAFQLAPIGPCDADPTSPIVNQSKESKMPETPIFAELRTLAPEITRGFVVVILVVHVVLTGVLHHFIH